jgi:hypothetical protein
MIYLTPAQLRAMDLPVDLSGLSDAQVAQWIFTSGQAVNSFCNQSNLPVPHDFRGGAITGETHTWEIDPYERDVRRRVFPYHTPIIDVTSVRIYATLDQYLELDASQIYYETSEGWIEPASANMTSYGLFGAAMLPYVGLAHPHVSLDYTYGSLYPTTERIYPDAVLADTWRAMVGFWDATTPIVEVNGTPSVSFTSDPIEGTITFTGTPPSPTDAIDVTYVGTLHPNISRATGIITAAKLIEKGLISGGLGGLRMLRVAEITLERAVPRQGTASVEPPTVPAEAADLLSEFVHRALVWA